MTSSIKETLGPLLF
uniref:Uncharacterized protein n=1 Tax=Arundo donax TaxID=35708 RepID=A0A0A9C711_ARUDO